MHLCDKLALKLPNQMLDSVLTLIEFLQILAKNLGVSLQRETMTSLKLPLVSLFTCFTRSFPNIV